MAEEEEEEEEEEGKEERVGERQDLGINSEGKKVAFNLSWRNINDEITIHFTTLLLNLYATRSHTHTSLVS